jgi:protein-S-isoprenylcysteine O-methyltransferase Ste14
VSEADVHRALTLGVIGVGAVVFVALFFVSAPYGRHARRGWGPTMPARWAWVVMESPAVLAFAGVYLVGEHRWELVPVTLLALWQLHYVNRTFVFPFRMRAEGKRTPVSVVALAIVFNSINAYVNARWISHLGNYATSWLFDPRFVLGVGTFLVGRTINVRSDGTLLALRAKSRSGQDYAIPRGGLYHWVSCPNYLGEIVEWLGWALASWSLAGLSFALFTFANLAPRAHANHRWYRETFDDYPRERRAFIPYFW